MVWGVTSRFDGDGADARYVNFIFSHSIGIVARSPLNTIPGGIHTFLGTKYSRKVLVPKCSRTLWRRTIINWNLLVEKKNTFFGPKIGFICCCF